MLRRYTVFAILLCHIPAVAVRVYSLTAFLVAGVSVNTTTLFYHYLHPQRARVLLLAVLLAAAIASQLTIPQVLRSFIDATQTSGLANATIGTAMAYLLLALLHRLTMLATTYVGEDLGWRTTNQLRHDLTGHVLSLDMSFHKAHTAGALLERVEGDCDELRNFFSQFGPQVLGNGLLALGVLLLVFREDWRLGVSFSIYAVAVVAILIASQRFTVRRWQALRDAETETTSFLEERMAATEDLRSAGAEAYTLRELSKRTTTQLERRRSAELAANGAFVGTNFLFLCGYAIGLGVGASLFLSGQATIGTAFLIATYIGMLSDPLETIRSQVQDLQKSVASINRIQQLLQEQPRLSMQGSATLPTGAFAVHAQQVSFRYRDTPTGSFEEPAAPTEEQPPTLDTISFALSSGEQLGLLGRTGSGKSTLARLLARLYDPDTGAILLNGIDLRQLNPAELRKRVAVVTQDVQIFQATIRENLTLFRPDISDAQLEQALDALGLLGWVQQLPAGLATQLGPGGLGLSAGEAQLLAFARVFLNNPGLVILDEASSRLDPATERLLDRAISTLLAGRTAIIIAHRLGTVQRTDRILILEQGQIAEYGLRSELAANPASRFAQLLHVGMEEALV
jgi:ATP-binding cassette, subfamily B, bacterial